MILVKRLMGAPGISWPNLRLDLNYVNVFCQLYKNGNKTDVHFKPGYLDFVVENVVRWLILNKYLTHDKNLQKNNFESK